MPIGPSVLVNDRLFPVELTEIADWKSMSEYVTFEYWKNLDKGHLRKFWCIYLYIAASLFPRYMPTFLDVLSTERILKQKKILRNFREQTQVFDKPTRVVLFELIQRGIAKCCS